MELGDMLLHGKNHVVIYPANERRAAENAKFYQADSSSNFGMMILESGGVVADGAVRLFGSTENAEFRDIRAFNEKHGGEGIVILGDDIFGGVFALNAGGFPEDPGRIFYFAPDCCDWESMGLKLSGLFAWLKDGDLPGFYGQFSGEEYQRLKEMRLPFNKVLHFVPPQWSLEFKTEKHDVRPISVGEYYDMTFER